MSYVLFRCQCCCVLFFFKQKTAYEMRISDWSSDVCSSDLGCARPPFLGVPQWTARPGERASALVCAWAVRMTGYAELAAATNFSFLRGASQPADMVAQAISLGLQGIGKIGRAHV